MKTLIAYYSGTGKTKVAAERIQQVCGGDIIEIKGKKKIWSISDEVAYRSQGDIDERIPSFVYADR